MLSEKKIIGKLSPDDLVTVETAEGTRKRDIKGKLHTLEKWEELVAEADQKVTVIIDKFIEGVRNDKKYKNVSKEIDRVVAKIEILAPRPKHVPSNTNRESIDQKVQITAAREAARTAFDKISEAADAILSCKQFTDENACEQNSDCQFVVYSKGDAECQNKPEKVNEKVNELGLRSGDMYQIFLYLYGDLTYHNSTESKENVMKVLRFLELDKLDHAEVAADRREQIVRDFNFENFVKKYQEIKQTQEQNHESADPSTALMEMSLDKMKARCKDIMSTQQQDTLNRMLKEPSKYLPEACEILESFLEDKFPEVTLELAKLEKMEKGSSRAETSALYRGVGAFGMTIFTCLVIIASAVIVMHMPAAATAWPAWAAFGGYLNANVSAVSIIVPILSSLAGMLSRF